MVDMAPPANGTIIAGQPSFLRLRTSNYTGFLARSPRHGIARCGYAIAVKGVGRFKFGRKLPDGELKMIRVVKTARRVILQFVMEHPIEGNYIPSYPSEGIGCKLASREAEGEKVREHEFR